MIGTRELLHGRVIHGEVIVPGCCVYCELVRAITHTKDATLELLEREARTRAGGCSGAPRASRIICLRDRSTNFLGGL